MLHVHGTSHLRMHLTSLIQVEAYKYQQNPTKWFKLSRKGHGCLFLAVLSTVAPLEDQDSSNIVWFACVFHNMGTKLTTEQKYLCMRHCEIDELEKLPVQFI